MALPRALRAPRGAGDLARHLRRALRCSTRARSPRSSCRTRTRAPTGSTAPTWTPASSASACSPRRSTPGLDVPDNAVLLDALVAAAMPDPSRAGGAAAAAARGRRLRAPDRRPGVAPLREFSRRRLRRPRRGRAGRAQHRPGRQLRLPDRLGLHPERRHSRRGRPDRHRCAEGDWRASAASAAATMHRFSAPGRAAAGGAVPQPPLQLPPRRRHRRPDNSFLLGQLEAARPPRAAAQRLDARRGAVDERDRRPAGPRRMRQWQVINPSRRNAFGEPTGYVVESHNYDEPLLAQGRLPARRLHRAPAVGHGASTPTSATPPATRRTRTPARRGCRSTCATTRAWSTATSCSG